jgi:mobilome CxxCx(11)CxxC protein
VLVILKMSYRWQERAETHSKLLGQNISMAGQAYTFMKTGEPSSETVALFRAAASTLEQQDREALGTVKPQDKHSAFREALKEFEPGDTAVTCPICKASPWRFTAGECQMCGNTSIK